MVHKGRSQRGSAKSNSNTVTLKGGAVSRNRADQYPREAPSTKSGESQRFQIINIYIK